MAEGDVKFHVRVTGIEYRQHSTMVWPFEDEYEITAESAPEALLQLIHRDLWWDTLDIERPFTIEITPDEVAA